MIKDIIIDCNDRNYSFIRIRDLATRNSVRFGDAHPTTILARPTPIHTRAFELLGLKPAA